MILKKILFASVLSATIGLMNCSSSGDSNSGSTGESAAVAVTDVSITPTSNAATRIEIGKGSTLLLRAQITPSNATNKSIAWSVNPAVAGIAVDANGKVSVSNSVSASTTAKVVVTTNDGNKTATAYIKVVPLPTAEVMKPAILMASLPANGINFPMKLDDTGTGNIKHKFSMAQTEVTYELWKKVYDWATHSDRGSQKYKFANAGKEGHNGIIGAAPTADKNEPVTGISWRDSVIWCNSYTEWSNATKGTNYTVVYKKSGTPLRDATAISDVDALTFDPATNTETGFRLPTSEEWAFAARWQGTTDRGNSVKKTSNGVDYYFTKGDSASGAADNNNNATETGKVAWYDTNANSKTQPVAGKSPNALGLYDMSGNVWEWIFYISGSKRGVRGASWVNGKYFLRLGLRLGNDTDGTSSLHGFRPARTQN